MPRNTLSRGPSMQNMRIPAASPTPAPAIATLSVRTFSLFFSSLRVRMYLCMCTGEIPTEVGKMKSLVAFALDGNAITGERQTCGTTCNTWRVCRTSFFFRRDQFFYRNLKLAVRRREFKESWCPDSCLITFARWGQQAVHPSPSSTKIGVDGGVLIYRTR